MDCKRTGKFIYEMRVRKGFTQKELADKLNITDRAVSKWERGLGIPDVSLLNELSLVLDVSVSEILNGEKFNIKKFLVVILMVIFIRKVLQGVTGIGVFDINDVILNYFGVIVALMISRKILTNN